MYYTISSLVACKLNLQKLWLKSKNFIFYKKNKKLSAFFFPDRWKTISERFILLRDTNRTKEYA